MPSYIQILRYHYLLDTAPHAENPFNTIVFFFIIIPSKIDISLFLLKDRQYSEAFFLSPFANPSFLPARFFIKFRLQPYFYFIFQDNRFVLTIFGFFLEINNSISQDSAPFISIQYSHI
jgi:hypothetical protein